MGRGNMLLYSVPRPPPPPPTTPGRALLSSSAEQSPLAALARRQTMCQLHKAVASLLCLNFLAWHGIPPVAPGEAAVGGAETKAAGRLRHMALGVARPASLIVGAWKVFVWEICRVDDGEPWNILCHMPSLSPRIKTHAEQIQARAGSRSGAVARGVGTFARRTDGGGVQC